VSEGNGSPKAGLHKGFLSNKVDEGADVRRRNTGSESSDVKRRKTGSEPEGEVPRGVDMWGGIGTDY